MFDPLDRRSWGDRLRSYTDVLDEEKVGTISLGEWITIATSPGPHEHLSIDWARSPRLEFELGDGEEFAVECWSNMNPLYWPYWITFGRSQYIGIAPANNDSTKGTVS